MQTTRKIKPFLALGLLLTLLNNNLILAQENTKCQVILKALDGEYSGGCKKGFAHGRGEATGIHHYVGFFKNGLPNGEGIYYYSDSTYHKGRFQNGVKEGKGETHYLTKAMPDSIIRGYWSADLFRGKEYVTYKYEGGFRMDRSEILSSSGSGNTLTFEITTTSNSYELTLVQLTDDSGKNIRMQSNYATAFKSSVTYVLDSFPISLTGRLSNMDMFQLELYKAAHWTVRFYVNR